MKGQTKGATLNAHLKCKDNVNVRQIGSPNDRYIALYCIVLYCIGGHLDVQL